MRWLLYIAAALAVWWLWRNWRRVAPGIRRAARAVGAPLGGVRAEQVPDYVGEFRDGGPDPVPGCASEGCKC